MNLRIWKVVAVSISTVLLLASCDRPDASGIYVSASDRSVALVQIVETKDSVLTGRVEELFITSDGTVKDRTIPLDGAASGKDLLFKPTSAWFGGLQATGTLTDGGLTLTAAGASLFAARSTMENYQAAVVRLQELAATDRQKIANARALQAQQAAQAHKIQSIANTTASIENATVRLRSDVDRMSKGIANSPDFGARSAANTARIAKMLKIAPMLSGVQRGQLAAQASQIEVGTNQIEVARSQYVIAMNDIVHDAGMIVEQIARLCDPPQDNQFAGPCGPAKAVAMDYKTSLERGRNFFSDYKQTVQAEISRQDVLIQQMDRMQ